MVDAEEPRSNVEILLGALAGRREELALVHGDRRMTSGELVDQVYRVARALAEHGLGPGRTVTLLGANAPEMLIARYAANLLGASVAQLYNGMSVSTKAAVLSDVDTTALLYDRAFADSAEQVLQGCKPELVFGLGPGEPGTDLLRLAAEQPAEPLAGRARPGDVQQIRHTGGTTGHPKGVCYTFGSVLRATQQRHGGPFDLSAPRQLAATTLAHAAGGLADGTLQRGGYVVLHDEFDPGAVLRTIEAEGITSMWLLPPLLYQLLDHPEFDQRDLSSLQNIIYGGCAASRSRLVEAARKLGPVLYQIYGQTEAGLMSVLPPEEHDPERPELLSTAGRIAASADIAVCDSDGEPVAPGQPGELWARTPAHMDHYWKQPELTARTVQNGWVHTGDVGYLDDAGYLHLIDRVKDMIIVVGGHVYTSEVEEVLFAHPQVRMAAVFGVPDPNGAEVVHAAIVPEAGADVDAEQLREFVGRRQGPMYRPRNIHLVQRLPLTDVGKPDKKALRTQLVETGEH